VNQQTGLSGLCDIILSNGHTCGIQAIGRCATCMRAFCSSHQAYNKDVFGYPIPAHNMCSMCAEARRKAEEEAFNERHADLTFFQSGKALEVLRSSSVQKVNVYYLATTWEKGFLGREKKHQQYKLLGHGWVIGTLNWSERLVGSLGYDGTYATAFMDDLIRDRSSQGVYSEVTFHNRLIPVVPYTDGYAYVRAAHAWGSADTKTAYQAVRKLVGINP
jgi:hypothetical protein